MPSGVVVRLSALPACTLLPGTLPSQHSCAGLNGWDRARTLRCCFCSQGTGASVHAAESKAVQEPTRSYQQSFQGGRQPALRGIGSRRVDWRRRLLRFGRQRRLLLLLLLQDLCSWLLSCSWQLLLHQLVHSL